jgi:hypothetical protein
MAIVQTPLAGMEPYKARPTYVELLQIALEKEGAIDVIKELVAMEKDAQARSAEIEFNEAMNAVQMEIGRVAPDLTNSQTRSKYASYAAIDKVIRPIYTRHGFSLSFTDEPLDPALEMVRIVGFLSHRAGHTRKYLKDMPADGKGAKGGDVMTKTHARGAADAYAKRYMVKDIFNVAVGEEDTDGAFESSSGIYERIEWIANAKDLPELQKLFTDAYKTFGASRQSQQLLVQAKDKRKAELS